MRPFFSKESAHHQRCGHLDDGRRRAGNGDAAIKRWIDDQLKSTSVTAVLIGAETAGRDWVQHEILRSWNRGNGIVGVRIHNIKDQNQKTDTAGANPLDQFKLPDGTLLSSVCKTYDWVLDDGRKSLGKWADEAAKKRAQFSADDEIVAVAKSAKPSTVVSASAYSGGFRTVGGAYTTAPELPFGSIGGYKSVLSGGFSDLVEWSSH